MRRAFRFGLCLAASVALVAAPSVARAGCPETGSTDVCHPYSGTLLPSAFGALYAPLDGRYGMWGGGGLELVLFTWTSNSDGFGPSQGKIRFDIAGLASTQTAPAMVMFNGGAAVSFEGNAARSWLIPHFGGSVGAFAGGGLPTHGFVDGELGLYLVYVRGFILDAGGAFVFPFTDFEHLAGPKAQLTASFALW